ncbi:gamma-glutamyl-gamma-aminobutyrate hydrolase family protein [Thermosyntropha sp.]|uniref:gamma-glutamyl-gamma-aminobutyrate hydrolase family protein n=1 Tax=Thermosyntropha sp. TaxID=2740820 RepID=UPI0025FCA3B6|nr:gamma-glutamyl-gamma-aminobutyrate hydrolase family protein [Thermosyntropha sp.]MBO8158250.1 gamma-glutamyl-gamma-aminobutyrate hydrolase family protein [Thermosyntropha sp.]
MRPVIGITGDFFEEENLLRLKKYYIDMVMKAGGIGIILAPVEDEFIINNYINICDGFIFSGGGDIDPCYWGEAATPSMREINPLRDRFEIMLGRKILGGNIPALGICRGCQLLNVAAGGSIVQNIVSLMSHEQKAPRSYPFHDIFIEEESILYKILGTGRIKVNSFHHQAVNKPGNGIKVSARSADGVVEAVESENHYFVIGVQWHPECMDDKYSFLLFKALIGACLRYIY